MAGAWTPCSCARACRGFRSNRPRAVHQSRWRTAEGRRFALLRALPKALRVHLPLGSPLVVQADDLLAHGK